MARPTDGGEVDIPSNGLICWYYMSAIQNMSVLEDVHGVRLLGICAPPDTHLMDFVRIFVQKAQKEKDAKQKCCGSCGCRSQSIISM